NQLAFDRITSADQWIGGKLQPVYSYFNRRITQLGNRDLKVVIQVIVTCSQAKLRMLSLRRIDAQSDNAAWLQIIQIVIHDNCVEILNGVGFFYREPIVIHHRHDELITKEKERIPNRSKPVLGGFYVLHHHGPRSKINEFADDGEVESGNVEDRQVFWLLERHFCSESLLDSADGRGAYLFFCQQEFDSLQLGRVVDVEFHSFYLEEMRMGVIRVTNRE